MRNKVCGKSRKREIVERIISRVQTGLWFVEEYLARNQGTDMAGLRSIYILLSFNFEILIKAGYIIANSFLDKDELEEKLKKLGHNIEFMGRELGQDILKNINVKSILKKDYVYNIETIAGQMIYIKDFTDIRYDFIEGKIRSITQGEHDIIKGSIGGVRDILDKIIFLNK